MPGKRVLWYCAAGGNRFSSVAAGRACSVVHILLNHTNTYLCSTIHGKCCCLRSQGFVMITTGNVYGSIKFIPWKSKYSIWTKSISFWWCSVLRPQGFEMLQIIKWYVSSPVVLGDRRPGDLSNTMTIYHGSNRDLWLIKPCGRPSHS